MSPLPFEHPEWSFAVSLGVAGVLLALAAANAVARPRLRALQGVAGPVSWRGSALRDALLVGALACVGVALLGPRIGERSVRTSTAGIDLVLLLDASQSMDALDPAPSRLARAQRAAVGILDRLGSGDRVALAAYAGRGVLLTPLTPDHAALAELVGAIDSRLVRPGGSHLRAGVAAALEAFDPADERARVVLVLGDGEVLPEASDVGSALADRAGVRVFAAGFGSEAGAAVPDRGAALLDRSGREVVSRRRTEAFDALAHDTGGVSWVADAWGELDLAAMVEALRSDARVSEADFAETRVTVAVVWPFAAAAFALLLGELAWPWGARLRRLRLAQATALAVAAVAIGAGRPEASPSPALLIDAGRRHAEQGSWAAARRAFLAAAITASDPRVAGLAYHNLGFAALREGEHEAARDAFFDSLALRPGNRQTQFDLEWTLRRLEVRDSDPPERPQQRKPEAAPAASDAPAPEAEDAADVRAPHSTGESEPGSESGEARAGRVRLGPDERKRWLGRVEDDTGAAIRDTASRGARPGSRPRGAPSW